MNWLSIHPLHHEVSSYFLFLNKLSSFLVSFFFFLLGCWAWDDFTFKTMLLLFLEQLSEYWLSWISSFVKSISSRSLYHTRTWNCSVMFYQTPDKSWVGRIIGFDRKPDVPFDLEHVNTIRYSKLCELLSPHCNIAWLYFAVDLLWTFSSIIIIITAFQYL